MPYWQRLSISSGSNGLRWGSISQQAGRVFSHRALSKPPTNARPPSSPKFIRAHYIMARPPLVSHPSFCFSCSHIHWRRWRKRIRAPASSGWVCGRASLPTHSYRMEGEGEPSIQAVQSHICTRWMRLLGGWTSGFSASLDGCAPGLPGQDARQWGSRSGFSLSQWPEEHDRPGSTHHQSHRSSHRAFDVQPYSVGAPPLAHDDGDERGGQSSLPGLVHVAGSERHVLSHPGSPLSQTILEICIRRGGISIQGPAVWAIPGSPHFYTMHGCGSLPSVTDGNLHTQLPRWLAHSGPVTGGFNIAQDPPPQPLRLPGAQGQLCQEHTVTQPTSLFLGTVIDCSCNFLNGASHDNSAPRGLHKGRYRPSAQSFPENAGPYGTSA